MDSMIAGEFGASELVDGLHDAEYEKQGHWDAHTLRFHRWNSVVESYEGIPMRV